MAIVRITGVRVVAFDLDDTLYPERSFAFSGFEAVARWLRQRMDCPFEPAERMRELFDSPHRPRIFDQVLAESGAQPTPALIADMVACYRSHRPAIALFPDAEEALTRWSGRCHLALISDGPWTMQQNKVEALGLTGRLDPIILTDAWGQDFWKPHPRAFQEIERAWGARSSACAYIADNAAKDFLAPRALGWQTVQVGRPGAIHSDGFPPPKGEPDWQVFSLDEIDISH